MLDRVLTAMTALLTFLFALVRIWAGAVAMMLGVDREEMALLRMAWT